MRLTVYLLPDRGPISPVELDLLDVFATLTPPRPAEGLNGSVGYRVMLPAGSAEVLRDGADVSTDVDDPVAAGTGTAVSGDGARLSEQLARIRRARVRRGQRALGG